MTDTEKVYHYEKLLNLTINSYKEMKKDAERILILVPDNISLKQCITDYNDIIKILSTILERLGG